MEEIGSTPEGHVVEGLEATTSIHGFGTIRILEAEVYARGGSYYC